MSRGPVTRFRASASPATGYSQIARSPDRKVVALGEERVLEPDALFGGPKAPVDVEDRVALVSTTMYDFVVKRETQFRRFLPTQIVRGIEPTDERGPVRPAYRIAMIDAALEPIADELTSRQRVRLDHALGVLVGPEALIAMRDVLRVDHATARQELAWACRALVRAARAEAAAARDARTSAPRPRGSKARPARR